MKERIVGVIDAKRFSKFIGSPVPGTKDILALESGKVAEIDDVVTYLGGPSVRNLEALWSRFHECDFSITVNSATSGLTVAVMAVDVGPGDEVIISPFSFTASATAIVAANAIPVFADIDLETFCLSPENAEAAVTESTKAIMPVHWNGNGSDLSSITTLAKSKGLKVIEDAAQAPGTKYEGKFLGTHGDVGVFSLNEPKNIMTGEGGVIVTNDKTIAAKSRLIRNHGEVIVDDTFTEDMTANIVGSNFRLVELLAELGICQIEKLEYLNKIRRENHFYLAERLVSECGEYLVPQKITHLDTYNPYHTGFRWLSEKSNIHKNIIAKVLRQEGIPVSPGISRLMSDHPLFQKKIAYGLGQCPFSCHLYGRKDVYTIGNLLNAKRLQQDEYLGFTQVGWPNTEEDMEDIVSAFKKILANKSVLENEPSLNSKNEFISGR